MSGSDVLDPRLQAMAGRLVVSCQAYPGEPLRDPWTTARMCAAVVAGGAAAVRVQGVEDVARAAERIDVPVVGLWKDGPHDIVITPTLEHARAVRAAGADVVALDGTRRPRPDGLTLAETVRRLKDDAATLVMADAGSLEDALAAQDAGVDLVGTTLAGYTGERAPTDGPDLALVGELAARLEVPVVAEGRVHTPAQARAALDAGAWSVVVGTAITHPTTITGWFADALAR